MVVLQSFVTFMLIGLKIFAVVVGSLFLQVESQDYSPGKRRSTILEPRKFTPNVIGNSLVRFCVSVNFLP